MRMRFYFLTGLFIALSLLVTGLYPHTTPAPKLDVLAISSGPEEIRREASPVAGTIVIGVLPSDELGSRRPSPVVKLPPLSGPNLCVHITSADGLYEWKAEYAISDSAPGTKTLEYTSDHPDTLDSYKSEDLAIAAVMKDDCADSPGDHAYIPAHWNGDELEKGSGSLSIAVQSGGKNAVIRWGEEKLTEHETCYRRSLDKDNVAFDTICTVPTQGEGGEFNYRIELSEFGTKVKAGNIKISY